MSSKITMALVAAIIAFASPALAQITGKGDNAYTSQYSRHCTQQYDSSGAPKPPYCH